MKKILLIKTTMNDFSNHVYEGIYDDVVDLKELKGIHTIASDETIFAINQKMISRDTQNIYFLGNGNYHHLTLAVMYTYTIPFTLIVFDHHNDALPLSYLGFTSCGSWIKDAIAQIKTMKEVIVIGVSKENTPIEAIEDNLNVRYVTPETFTEKTMDSLFESILTEHIYISVDRDVFSTDVVSTNWDQGTMSLEQVTKTIAYLTDRHTLIGGDVCGDMEWDFRTAHHERFHTERRQARNTNQVLLVLLRKALKEEQSSSKRRGMKRSPFKRQRDVIQQIRKFHAKKPET